ncbi:hypothetical protein QBC32DRAFT_313377 [Pseudoneurospora amorphoporcata]|uniref:CFEM domain-containing protein n=1 Tax=Pseudoneurospora amorphoporcata TaxID=241081 RepID=A0AAN6SGP4_9PEZI|nr:hypothetical protein QBC32DRAFT_313377 [Pseudoneurospora amorphoporcata]
MATDVRRGKTDFIKILRVQKSVRMEDGKGCRPSITTILITFLSSIAFTSALPHFECQCKNAAAMQAAVMPCVAQACGAALAPVVGQVANAICEKCVTKA